MSLTWDQIGNLGLTAAQKNKLAQAEEIGLQVGRPGPGPIDTSTVTAAQAKQVRSFVRDMRERLEPALRGAEYILRKMKEDAAASADAAVPDAPL